MIDAYSCHAIRLQNIQVFFCFLRQSYKSKCWWCKVGRFLYWCNESQNILYNLVWIEIGLGGYMRAVCHLTHWSLPFFFSTTSPKTHMQIHTIAETLLSNHAKPWDPTIQTEPNLKALSQSQDSKLKSGIDWLVATGARKGKENKRRQPLLIDYHERHFCYQLEGRVLCLYQEEMLAFSK